MRRWIVGASMLCLAWVGSIPSTSSAAAPSISAGAAHALAVRADGTALAWGANESGELGQGTSTASSSDIVQSLVPLAVPGLANVASVAAMRTVAAAVTRDGHVYVWGSLGGKILAPTLVAAISGVRIVSITAGAFVALKNDGTVWTWSNAEAASLAAVSIPGRVVAIAGGAAHALAVTDDGSVWSWGGNSNGQLGDGTTTDRPAPARVPGISGATAVAAGDTHSLAVTNDGRVWGWGGNSGAVLGNALGPPRLTPGVIAGLPAATAVDAKAFRSIALAADGTAWHWGDGPATPTQMPGVTIAASVAAGNPHFMVILRSGTLMTWGINEFGEIGNGSTQPQFMSPFAVTSLGSVASVAGGDAFTIAAKSDGTVWTWGHNDGGQLGLAGVGGAPPVFARSIPTPVPGLQGVVSVSAAGLPGREHSLAALSDGSAWAWGDNSFGQFGQGIIQPSSATPVRVQGVANAVSVSAGMTLQLALARDGTVWQWGEVPGGRGTPSLVPVLDRVVRIAAGNAHGLALRDDGTLWSWGDNTSGALGNGTIGGSQPTPQRIASLSGVVAIAAGAAQSLAALADGTVWAWGKAGDGFAPALGLPPSSPDQAVPLRIAGVANAIDVSISKTNGHALALSRDGRVFAWGSDFQGELGDGLSQPYRSTPAIVAKVENGSAVAAGTGYSLVLLSGGGVLVWGSNTTGALGDGTFVKRPSPVAVESDNGRGPLDLSPADGTAGVAAELLAPFDVVATRDAFSGTANASAFVSFRPSDVGSNGSVFAFALAPAGIVQPPAKRARASEGAADTPLDFPNQCVLAQLDSSGHLVQISASDLIALASGILAAQGQAVTILNNVPVGQVAGATFYVGYGTNANAMLASGTSRSVASVPGGVDCHPQTPQTGWWWNPAEGGRGYSLEISGNRIFFAAFLYDASGHATWYVASGATSFDGAVFTGRLLSVSHGQTLGGPYMAPAPIVDNGPIALAFTDATHGTMIWPGGTVPIQRFDFVADGSTAPPLPDQPEPGWWWNPDENGRGFFVEWQKGTADLAGYMYDDSGSAVWYITLAAAGDPKALAATWWQYAGGQTLAGAYQPATRISDNVAPVTVTFQTPSIAVMTLPGGRQLPLKRFRF